MLFCWSAIPPPPPLCRTPFVHNYWGRERFHPGCFLPVREQLKMACRWRLTSCAASRFSEAAAPTPLRVRLHLPRDHDNVSLPQHRLLG